MSHIPPQARTPSRIAWIAVLAAALLAIAPGRAWAHASLVRSTPKAGARVTPSLGRVALVFSEALEMSMTGMALVGPDGTSSDLVAVQDPHDVHAILATVGTLAPGAYRLTYHVVSADGHPVRGAIDFVVVGEPAAGGATVAPPAVRTAPPPASMTSDSVDVVPSWGPALAGAPVVPALLRGAALAALMALGGLLWFVRAGGDTARGPMRMALGLALAAPLLLVAHMWAWVMNVAPGHRLSSETLGAALGSRSGHVELWRIGLAVLVLWALALARRPRLALAFAVAALLVSGATGHPAAIQPALAIPAKAIHLLAGAAWLGALLWLVSRPRTDHAEDVREAGRVSSVALASIIAVTLTGVVQAALFIATPRDLVHSAYGLLVLLKTACLLVLLVYGYHHRTRVLPALRESGDGFGATLRQEVAVMVLTILVGGLLAYVPPAAAPAAAQVSLLTR